MIQISSILTPFFKYKSENEYFDSSLGLSINNFDFNAHFCDFMIDKSYIYD